MGLVIQVGAIVDRNVDPVAGVVSRSRMKSRTVLADALVGRDAAKSVERLARAASGGFLQSRRPRATTSARQCNDVVAPWRERLDLGQTVLPDALVERFRVGLEVEEERANELLSRGTAMAGGPDLLKCRVEARQDRLPDGQIDVRLRGVADQPAGSVHVIAHVRTIRDVMYIT